MPAIRLWVRREARRRLRSLLVLTLLIALAGGVVLSAIAGARRNGSAVPRLVDRTIPAHVWVLANQPGFDWDQVRQLPEVESVAEFLVGGPAIEGRPDLTELMAFPAASPEAMTRLEVPVVVEGRLPDPQRIDEFTITPDMRSMGVHIGDHLTLAMSRPETIDAQYTGSAPPDVLDGPRQEVTVVGVVKGAFFADTTYAFFERYRDNLAGHVGYINAVIRLRDPVFGVQQLQRDLDRIGGRPIEVVNAASQRQRTKNATDLERTALFAFAVSAGVASIVLVGQAVVRMVNSVAVDLPLLRAFGVTRGEALVAVAAMPVAAGTVGAVGALGVAYALSARYPIGVGRRYEPDPGAHFDVTVLGLGLVAMLVVVVAGAVGLGVIQVRARARRASGARSSKLVAAAAASGAPIPLALGARLALERGHGRAAVPVRPALIGAIVGVLGIVGTFTFHDGLDRAATDRALYGQRFDAFGGVLGGTALDPAIIDGLTADADVEMVQEIRDGVVLINGMNVPALGIRTVKGNEGLAARHGRLPSNDQEISLAPGELKALGVAVGDRVEVGADQVQMTVVGEAFNPELIHTDYDHGARFTDAGLRRFLSSDDDLKFHLFTLRLVRGVDAAATIERLNATVPEAGLDAPMPSETQLNLRGVRRVPVALGAFLALLAIAAVGHALATAVRRRRHDVAVLRVLGLTRTQARACVAWQATILAVIGIMIGAPLGIALGRTTWRVVADSTPMFYVAPLAAVALALVGPLAILIANALAAWPGRFAAQVRPAEVLRAE